MGILNKKGEINTLILLIAALIIVAISLVILAKVGDISARSLGELFEKLPQMAGELVKKAICNRTGGDC